MSDFERQGARDLTYSRLHRLEVRRQYPRIGHRLNTCDRDWTEFGYACRQPLAIVEEVRDVGQNLADKSTTLTRRLAQRAGLPALLVAWRVDRPAEVQREIDGINRRLRALEAAYPIVEITARRLTPLGKFHRMMPNQWWETLAIVHGLHHFACRRCATDLGRPVDAARLHEFVSRNPLWPELADTLPLPDLLKSAI